MYPWIGEVLDLLARHEIAVTINTNATLFTPRVIERLLALHELNLKCSIDAATRATYHRIRGSDLFERATANMQAFADAAGKRPHLRLIPIFVVMRENLGEVVPFVDLVEPMRPARVEFHPVRHITEWHVSNDTDWVFNGREQSCEFFADEYNAVMQRAAARCVAKGVECETLAL
jgi:wyosine [tRNA(Phe)-imidazoG37] synthetase (radical SAM superfamily)